MTVIYGPTGRPLSVVNDSLTNLVSRMGTDRDKAAGTYYGLSLLTDEQIYIAYKTAWLPRKIIDIPAFDSVRAWRDWQADDKQIEAIEAEEKRLNVKGKVLEAKIKARLWGGAAIMLGTVDTNLSQPLAVERIAKDGLKYLTVLTRRQLSAGERDNDPASEFFGKPKVYTLTTANAAQVAIHPSRLVIFVGNAEPDADLATMQGWGDSVLQSTMDAIKQADGTAANIASLVFEAKIDIIKVPNFTANLSTGGSAYEDQVLRRFSLAATSKGINGTLIMDGEEEYDSKSASFATLPDVLDRFLQIVSGAADIPATRLLGQSPAGMNATGTSDMKNYHDRLAAMQEIEMTPAMVRLDECLIRSALGSRDPGIYYRWAPLEQMSEKEKADIFKLKADAARALAGTGTSPELLPIEALSDALVNTFVEDNALPGLEAAIEEYGKLSEQEEDEEEVAASLPAPATPRQAANDAAPRTLYVRRNLLNGDDLIAWAKGQGFTTTLPADDMHVTITFSRQPVDWMKMGETWTGDNKGNLVVKPGGARLVEKLGPSATVLLFNSSELSWRHEDMVRNGASFDFDEYQPHVTISYTGAPDDLSKVEPYRGELRFGPEVFEEVNEDWKAGIVEDRYNPSQPRVPSGPNGGQWTSGAGSGSGVSPAPGTDMSPEQAQALYDERVVPEGWYVHGRSVVGQGEDDPLETGYVTQMTRDLDVADSYAREDGSVWYISPSEGASVVDLSGDGDGGALYEAFARDFDRGMLPVDVEQAISFRYSGADPRGAWEAVRDGFAPPSIVDSAGWYDNESVVNWIYNEVGLDFVMTPDGAVAFNKQALGRGRVVNRDSAASERNPTLIFQRVPVRKG